MTKRFGDWVRKEMDGHKYSNKDVVGLIFDELDPKDAIGTVNTKLSKLLNGDSEGCRYFFESDRPDRLAALAKSIGRTVDELEDVRARSERARTLILDPRFHSDHVAALIDISRIEGAGFTCVTVSGTGDVRRNLRDAADAAENPIVVVSNQADIEVLELAKLECTQLDVVPRGLRLRSHPGIIPVPSPRPPRAFAEDGTVLVPILDAKPSDHYYNRDDQLFQRSIQPALEREETPCLSLKDAITWWTRHGGLFGANGHRCIRWVASPELDSKHLLRNRDCDTQVWGEGAQIFAVGPRTDEVRAALSPYHETHDPPAVVGWLEGTQDANPWRLAEYASVPTHPLHEVRAAIQEWSLGAANAMINDLAAPPTTNGTLAQGVEPVAGREILRRISRREFTPKAASGAFVLARACEAPWFVFAATDATLDVLADMGAGTVLSLSVRRVVGPAAEVRWANPGNAYERPGRIQVLDCGDYIVALSYQCDPRLEGPLLPARERRRSERESEDESSYGD